MRSLLKLSERGKLILGTALILIELVAVLCLFDWQNGKDADLARNGVNIEQMIGGGE
ncbi:hypothetical protein [Mailhella massiliensis]|uniref:hypothetical protein n=1 Tax=Mailhella massiliensis TaxID=1903261 RepID=UPI0012B5F2DF|nr:hypothetical protein [Mailhella massiliensis]